MWIVLSEQRMNPEEILENLEQLAKQRQILIGWIRDDTDNSVIAAQAADWHERQGKRFVQYIVFEGDSIGIRSKCLSVTDLKP